MRSVVTSQVLGLTIITLIKLVPAQIQLWIDESSCTRTSGLQFTESDVTEATGWTVPTLKYVRLSQDRIQQQQPYASTLDDTRALYAADTWTAFFKLGQREENPPEVQRHINYLKNLTTVTVTRNRDDSDIRVHCDSKRWRPYDQNSDKGTPYTEKGDPVNKDLVKFIDPINHMWTMLNPSPDALGQTFNNYLGDFAGEPKKPRSVITFNVDSWGCDVYQSLRVCFIGPHGNLRNWPSHDLTELDKVVPRIFLHELLHTYPWKLDDLMVPGDNVYTGLTNTLRKPRVKVMNDVEAWAFYIYFNGGLAQGYLGWGLYVKRATLYAWSQTNPLSYPVVSNVAEYRTV